VYFLTVDRFARTDGDDTMCDSDYWCGGTIRGVTQHLDYIQDMGFDAVWITPVIGQRDKEPIPQGVSMGYHAWYWDEIDPHFGTSEDLVELSKQIHKRGMLLVYDIVMNHVGPIYNSSDVHQVKPFNETYYYHTRNISALPKTCGGKFCDDNLGRCTEQYCRESDFDQYVKSPLEGGPPCAFQCTDKGCEYPHTKFDCENYECQKGVPDSCVYRGKDAAGPPELLRCGVGDWSCPGYEGYDETLVTSGWDYILGDLNHSQPFVRRTLKDWARRMAETYDIDMFRLDTGFWVDKDFLKELQAEVPIPILGEVNPTPNMTFHSAYQSDAKLGHVLDGLLNFPIMFVATAAFCPSLGKFNFYPFANLNMTRLGSDMDAQLRGGLYRDELMLGNFVDNHDYVRIGAVCAGDKSRIFNALAWTMLAKGIPIIYQGTEQEMDKPADHGGYNGEDRTSLWQYGWNTSTPTFKFIAELNKLRKSHGLSTADAEVIHYEPTRLVFTRGGPHGVWVYLNNLQSAEGEVKYSALPAVPPAGKVWVSALTRQRAIFRDGYYAAPGTRPEFLVLADDEAPKPSIRSMLVVGSSSFVLGIIALAVGQALLGRAPGVQDAFARPGAYMELTTPGERREVGMMSPLRRAEHVP